jgi:hypothetical protein
MRLLPFFGRFNGLNFLLSVFLLDSLIVSHFSLFVKTKTKKVIKKETPRIVSRSAEREEGCAPSTAPPFEERHTRKRAAKTFFKMTMRITLSAS